MRHVTALVFTTLVLTACGGGGDGGNPTGPVAASIALTAASNDNLVSAGDTRGVTAVVKDASSTVIASPSVTWISSAPAVATVAGTGNNATVTAVGDGTATITASSGSATANVTVTVLRKFATLALTASDGNVLPGATSQLTATARDARQAGIPGVTGYTYTSSNPAKAIVSTTGLVTAIATGTSTITASLTRDGVTSTANATITVVLGTVAPTTANVAATVAQAFSPNAVTIAPGGTVTWQFAALAHNVTFGAAAGVPANIATTSNTGVSRTFATAGTYNYQCTIHAGMTGVVNVVAGALPSFSANLTGADERPNPIVTNGSGSALFYVNGTTVTYTVVWAGLTGPAMMAHIHGPGNSGQAVGVLVDFAPANQTVNNGVLTGSFTAANIRPQGGNPAISLDSLVKLMGNGNAYVNVHTTVNPGGEIRGQLAVPQ